MEIAKKLNLIMPEWFKDNVVSVRYGNILYDEYVNEESNEKIVITRCCMHSESELFELG